MPRTTRLDAPGVVHHVMIRGIKRRKIFRNNKEHKLRRQGYDLDRIAQRVSEVLEMKPEDVFSRGRQNRKVTARILAEKVT